MYGYGRVSSTHQELALQRVALRKAGVRRLYEEKASGAGVRRPVLEWLLDRMKPGDELVVWKIDRLSRSLRDLLSIVDQLAAKGCGFRSLTEGFDLSTPMGRLTLQILGAFAEWDRAMIRERCLAGRREAIGRGVVFGRRRLVDYSRLLELRAERTPWAEVAGEFGVSVSTARSALRRVLAGATTIADPREEATA